MTTTTTTYAVDGMTCGHCVAAVTKQLDSLPGVDGVEVSLDEGRATVTGYVPEAVVVAAVAEAGYAARPSP